MRLTPNNLASDRQLRLLIIRDRELTSLYGLAMNVGVIPCFIPTLLATNLNNMALSAIRPESVYANAVSKTPGPVSVSGISSFPLHSSFPFPLSPFFTFLLSYGPSAVVLACQAICSVPSKMFSLSPASVLCDSCETTLTVRFHFHTEIRSQII